MGIPAATQQEQYLELSCNLAELKKIKECIFQIACKSNQEINKKIYLACEEIFVNIANYAYSPNVGKATVRVEVSRDPVAVSITFMDNGKPFDPTAKADPDVTLSAGERQIGGLGIFMTKKLMDGVKYEYKDGRNILRIEKNLG